MFDNVKNYFNKVEEKIEVKNLEMVKIIKRNAYDSNDDEVIMLVREDYAKDICKLLNKENDRDKIFYQIIRVVEE